MSKTALLVDNDFFFAEFLSEMLEKRGYDVVKATDGKDAICKLGESTVDILFLEIIMPKIDGKQLIKFIRIKMPEATFPIIAMSGYLVEQMDELNEIGADYYIAKGAMEKMGEHVGAFLEKIEETPHPDPDDKIFLEPGQVYPRQSTAQLMDILNYQQAITDCAGVGLIIVDNDARIIHANLSALKMVKKSLEDILNMAITGIFSSAEKGSIVSALKRVIQEEGLRKVTFSTTFDTKEIQITVSALNVCDKKSGWVIAMAETVGI